MKWQGFFMTEHTEIVKRVDWDKKKVKKPILDENQLDEINQTICEAMEFNQDLTFTLYDNGEFRLLFGNVHYVDPIKHELKILDKFNEVYKVKFVDIISVHLQ